MALIIAVATALGLREWMPGLIQQITGRATQQRTELQTTAATERAERAAEIARLRADLAAAERDADRESCRRRIVYEHASQLRAQILSSGGTPPPFPDTTVCGDR